MKKSEVVQKILGSRFHTLPQNETGKAFAPSNIALCKYWGKRDSELNLPLTSSLSVSLQNLGAEVSITLHEEEEIFLNQAPLSLESGFARRLREYVNLFRSGETPSFSIHIRSDIPIAAGLASSASGFASVIKALNNLYAWQLNERELSIFARLGSGSACRSIWNGFVEWQAGAFADGMDSHGEPLETRWPELCLGLLIMDQNEKIISSREAMKRTVETSVLYESWPKTLEKDLEKMKMAIQEKNFQVLAETAESNAMSMHATMMSARPAILYALPETLFNMHKIWGLRKEGLPLYFTQDAGPNLKLLFLAENKKAVEAAFPSLQIISLFPTV